MSVAAEGKQSQSDDKDARVVAAERIGQGDPGLTNAAHAAQGARLDAEEEESALDYLLGDPQPVVHRIPVEYETPRGMRKLTFVTRSVDTRRIDEIETRNMGQNMMIDRITADCEIVALATLHLLDDRGRKVELTSEEFLSVRIRRGPGEPPETVRLASPATALERRFRDQIGLLNGVALQIKRAAGYGPDRVGQAKRVNQAETMLVQASLG